MRFVLLALVILAGCARPVAKQTPAFRDVTRPVGSAALLDVGQFAGRWYQVAHYPAAGTCPGDVIDIDGAQTMTTRCAPGANLTYAGRGRFTLTRANGAQETLWVLWVDHHYRTAVIGRPDGQIGAIWNRQPIIPGDRMKAAREILDFSGYDLSRLVEDVK